MKNSQLNRVIELVKKTNDRLVIMDQTSDDVLVLLPLSEYEKMIPNLKKQSELPGAQELRESEGVSESLPEGIGDSDSIFSLDDDFDSLEIETAPALEDDFFSDENNVVDHLSRDIKNEEKQLKTPVFKDKVAENINISRGETENLNDLPSEEVDPPFYLEPVE